MNAKNGFSRQSGLLFLAFFFCFLRLASGQPLSLSCLPSTGPTQAGAAYSATCTASGGTAPYSWSISSGSLPAGLTLTPSGDTSRASVAGTPNTAGPYNYTAQVTDNAHPQKTAQQNYSGTISPSITTINPSTTAAGQPGLTLTVNGAGFGSDSVVKFNTTALTTTVVSSTQVTAAVPANLINLAGTSQITVTSAGTASNAASFTVTPTISSLSPNSATAGSAAFTLTVNGTGFGAGATVNFNGTSLTATVANPTQLTASVPANLIASAGTVSVTVTSGGLTSNAANFTVSAAPAIASISPASTPAGSPAFTLTVNGSGFASGAVVNFNTTALTTTVVNANQLTASVPANLVASAGTAQVHVSSGGVNSNQVAFTIVAAPSIGSISPDTITAGSPAFTLTVNGGGFASGAVVNFNTTALTTTVVNANQLTASVPANLVASAGTAQVHVSSGGVNSNQVAFTIVAAPTIGSISPDTITAGSPAFTLTVNGSGFASGAVVNFNTTALTTTVVNANQLTASVPANLVASAGTAQVHVSSGGVDSNQVAFTIVAAPGIASISPDTITAGSPAFTLTVNGSGFASGAVVNWNGTALATSFSSSSQLTAPVLANLVATPGTAQITVSSGGVTSNSVNFSIVVGPAIASLSPNTTSAGGATFTLTVNGTGFASGAVVQWNATALTTTFVSATQLTAPVPANLISNASTVSVTVKSGGVTSNASPFTVVSGPTLSSLNPSTVAAGGAAFTLTVNGTGFASGGAVNWNGQPLTTTFVSASQLTASVPSSLIQSYGTAQITVVSGGATTNALPISLGVPAITLTGLQSTSAPTQQLQVGIQLASATPADLTGTLQLSFSTTAPGVPAGYVDPALQFAAGGTSLSFTIPAGSTSISPLSGGTIQQGTVEGTITVTLTSLTSGGTSVLPSSSVTASVAIPPLPPVITAGSAQITNLTATGFDVVLTGYSTTRDMTTANFTFTAAPGTQFSGPATFSVPMDSLFSTWFSSQAGQTNGSAFLLTVPFTLSGDSGVLQSVSVTLTNSVGTSVSASASQ